MSQLTITVSAKAEAMIAQLQKEIFNRRRKKVTAEGVVETLVESGAKSQSDKRFAASWKNLIKDIEKASKISETHGNKPANINQAEWALILSHRTRKGTTTKKTSAKKTPVNKSSTTKAKVTKTKASASKKAVSTKATNPRPAKRARKPVAIKVATAKL